MKKRSKSFWSAEWNQYFPRNKLLKNCGFDPSAPSLHIGNAVLIKKLSEFQKLGHQVIFLIGDFTGMIGDPTDKLATRKKMSRNDVLRNAQNYKKQASAYLDFAGDNPAELRHNSEWSDKITFKDLIEISSNFTVQQMIQRDMFQERIKEGKPIHFHEFLYPLAQGYDSVALDVDLEIGGNDQMFNMLCGRDLIKAVKNKEKLVLTMKLLADDKGAKMSKSEGNVVWLDDSPENMYGKVMSWPDGLIGIGFELCTNVPFDEMEKIHKELKKNRINPRDLKMKLAYEITKINHGKGRADEAQEYFVKTIQKKELPQEVRSEKLEVRIINIIDLLIKVKLASSKSEARRLIKQKGIKVDGTVILNENKKIDIKDGGIILQRGKHQFVKVVYE
jgi:tyrosyl-tRNA synthetase